MQNQAEEGTTYDTESNPSNMHSYLTTQWIGSKLEETHTDELPRGEHSSPYGHMSRIKDSAAARHLTDEALV